jgi:hypothetical protein
MRRSILACSLPTALLAFAVAPAGAALVEYRFDGTPTATDAEGTATANLSPTSPAVANLTTSPLTVSGATSYFNTNQEPDGAGKITDTDVTAPVLRIGQPLNSSSTTNWTAGDSSSDSASYTAAKNAEDYLQFSLTPASGYALDLSSISFHYAFGGTSGVRGVGVEYSFDGFASKTDLGLQVDSSQNNFVLYSKALADQNPVLNQTTSTVTFRVYGYTSGTGRLVQIDNLVVDGSVVVVPEPALGLPMVLAGGALLGRRRR